MDGPSLHPAGRSGPGIRSSGRWPAAVSRPWAGR